jgi:hypothetical protein
MAMLVDSDEETAAELLERLEEETPTSFTNMARKDFPPHAK